MIELIFDALLALALLAFMIFGSRIPAMSSANDIVEASGFPVIFALIGLILLALEIASQISKLKMEKASGNAPAFGRIDIKKGVKVAAIILMTIAYIFFVKYVGFVIFATVFAFISLNLLDSKKQTFNVIFAFASVMVLTLIFGRFFGIVLPRGQGIIKTLSLYLY